MTEAQFALLVLGIVTIGSNAFWAWNVQRLINKLMSRNYSEFKTADVTTERPEKKIERGPQQQALYDDMGALSDFN